MPALAQALLLRHGSQAARDLVTRHNLDDSANRPPVAARVLHARRAVAPRLVLGFLDRRRARLERSLVRRIDGLAVRHIESKNTWHRLRALHGLAAHDDGIANE